MTHPDAKPTFLSIFDPRSSLQARIALIVASLALTLAVVLTFVTGQISGQQLKSNIGHSLTQLSTNLVSQLDQTMFERSREIRITASQTRLFDNLDNADAVRLLLDQLTETNRDYYGGLPIDYRTTPPTINFTAQANVDAMRQVLDLARSGLITYQPLARNFGFFARGGSLDNPVYSQILNGFNFRPNTNPDTATNQNFTPVTYPKGTKTQLVAYSLGTLYISAAAQNADASYKWIKMLAAHPEILRLMPARQSLLKDTALDTAYGAPLAQTYRDIGKLLDDPNTITAASIVGGFNNLQSQAVQHWLYQAWDNYVQTGAGLEDGLTRAQEFATGFLQCAASIPAFDPKQQKYGDYQNALLACATKVDPTVKDL